MSIFNTLKYIQQSQKNILSSRPDEDSAKSSDLDYDSEEDEDEDDEPLII